MRKCCSQAGLHHCTASNDHYLSGHKRRTKSHYQLVLVSYITIYKWSSSLSLFIRPDYLINQAHGSDRITPSNATKAIAFAGNARKKQGTKPLQYPLHPRSR